MESSEALANHLGANLRAIRQTRGLTQAQLATLSAVPRSTIANIETGAGNPTLSVLALLATSLQLSMEELLSRPKGGCQVFRKGELPKIQKDGKRAVMQRLLPFPTPGMEIDRVGLQPGARFAGAPHRAGTSEYLACERGLLTVWVSGERFDLSPGDVAAFPGDQSHSYHNRGKTLAVGFAVVALTALPPSGKS